MVQVTTFSSHFPLKYLTTDTNLELKERRNTETKELQRYEDKVVNIINTRTTITVDWVSQQPS